MKKILVFSLLIALLPLIAYAQKNNSPTSKTIRFVIQDDVQSRIGTSSRYILELYKVENSVPTLITHLERNSNEFTVSLDPETSYSCLFWADNGIADDNTSGTFNASDLRAVTLNAGNQFTEAFACKEDFIMSENISSASIILKRAVARVEFVEEGTVVLAKDIIVSFMGYTVFDVFTHSVTGNSTNLSSTISTSATTGIVGSFLTFASIGAVSNGGIVVSLNVIYDGTNSHDINNVRLSTNHITKLRGEFAN